MECRISNNERRIEEGVDASPLAQHDNLSEGTGVERSIIAAEERTCRPPKADFIPGGAKDEITLCSSRGR